MRVSRVLCVLSFLSSTACAVGVELDPAYVRDAGRDSSVSQSGGRAGAGGSAQGSTSQTGPGASGAGGAGQAGASSNATGTGGTSAGGGGGAVDASGIGGANGDGAPGDVIVAVDTSNGCVSGQKVCAGRCVIPEARSGCDLRSCDPCPSPANSIAHCTGTECDFTCLSGYARSGALCVAGDGGGGGSGGSSNDAGPTRCIASQCGGCIPIIQAPCCKPDDTCGCQYPFFPCM